MSRTCGPARNARHRSPSSLRSKIHAGSENLSCVSVASSGSSQAGSSGLALGSESGPSVMGLKSYLVRHLLDVLSRLHRLRQVVLGIAARFRKLVGLLDQDPARLPPAAHPG